MTFGSKHNNIHTSKINLKICCAKWRPFCLGFNMIIYELDNHCSCICTSAGTIRFTLNTLRKNGRHFPGDMFKRKFLNENCCILITISLKFAHKGPISNIPALVHVMAWCLSGSHWNGGVFNKSQLNTPGHRWLRHAFLDFWSFW